MALFDKEKGYRVMCFDEPPITGNLYWIQQLSLYNFGYVNITESGTVKYFKTKEEAIEWADERTGKAHIKRTLMYGKKSVFYS